MNKKYICKNCGYLGESQIINKGSGCLEAFLWMFFIIPGLIYTIIRSFSEYKGCPLCEQALLIPVQSPEGQLLFEKYHKIETEEKTDIIQQINEESSNSYLDDKEGIFAASFIVIVIGIIFIISISLLGHH